MTRRANTEPRWRPREPHPTVPRGGGAETGVEPDHRNGMRIAIYYAVWAAVCAVLGGLAVA